MGTLISFPVGGLCRFVHFLACFCCVGQVVAEGPADEVGVGLGAYAVLSSELSSSAELFADGGAPVDGPAAAVALPALFPPFSAPQTNVRGKSSYSVLSASASPGCSLLYSNQHSSVVCGCTAATIASMLAFSLKCTD
jgi:hypothetical protein